MRAQCHFHATRHIFRGCCCCLFDSPWNAETLFFRLDLTFKNELIALNEKNKAAEAHSLYLVCERSHTILFFFIHFQRRWWWMRVFSFVCYLLANWTHILYLLCVSFQWWLDENKNTHIGITYKRCQVDSTCGLRAQKRIGAFYTGEKESTRGKILPSLLFVKLTIVISVLN